MARANSFWNRCVPWLPVVLIAAGAVVYANSLSGAFVFDDESEIIGNPQIRSLSDTSQVLGTAHRPIVTLSLAINYAAGELNVTGYHVVNVVVHILAGLTLFGIVRRTLLTDSLRERYEQAAPWLAAATAVIWLVHPLQTQSVTYIIQRSESMMGLFYLLTLYCAIRSAQGERRVGWAIAAVAASALGMGTKEVMVTAPLVVMLYDRTFLAGSFMGALRSRWGLYVSLAATWVILWRAFAFVLTAPSGASAGFTMQSITPVQYALTQQAVLVHYLRMSVWPAPLCLDYAWPIAQTAMQVVPYAVIIAALGLLTGWALWKRKAMGFVGAWFFLILAPTSSIMPIRDVAFEHRMYLSLAAVVVLAVMTGHRLLTALGPQKRALGGAVLCVIVIVLGFVTVQRNADYQTSVSIWRSVVDLKPDNLRAQYNLGTALQDIGQYDNTISIFRRVVRELPEHAKAHNNLGVALKVKGQLDEAIEHFLRALEINPDFMEAYGNMAVTLTSQGKMNEAIRYCRRALQIDPSVAPLYYTWGLALSGLGRHDEAADRFRKSLQLDPSAATVHHSLGATASAQGKTDEAIGHYRRALQLAPRQSNTHYNLGLSLQAQGKDAEAVGHLRQAVAIAPRHGPSRFQLGVALATTGQAREAVDMFREAHRLQPDWVLPINAAAWILATHAGADVRDPTEALRLAQRAAQLTRNRNATILDTLAAAYASAGRFDQAVATAQKALELAVNARAGSLAGSIRARLELFQQQQPYREQTPGQKGNRP